MGLANPHESGKRMSWWSIHANALGSWVLLSVWCFLTNSNRAPSWNGDESSKKSTDSRSHFLPFIIQPCVVASLLAFAPVYNVCFHLRLAALYNLINTRMHACVHPRGVSSIVYSPLFLLKVKCSARFPAQCAWHFNWVIRVDLCPSSTLLSGTAATVPAFPECL